MIGNVKVTELDGAGKLRVVVLVVPVTNWLLKELKYKGLLSVTLLVAKVNIAGVVSELESDPPAAKTKFPEASSVDVAEGVCEPCDPAPVTRAVLVRDAALVTHVAQLIAPAALNPMGEVAEEGIVPLPVGPVRVTVPAFDPGLITRGFAVAPAIFKLIWPGFAPEPARVRVACVVFCTPHVGVAVQVGSAALPSTDVPAPHDRNATLLVPSPSMKLWAVKVPSPVPPCATVIDVRP